MFEKHEINKYMEKQELITELSKIKEKLLCRKKASLLEMGYHESDEIGLYSMVSETSECAIKGFCGVTFRNNTNIVNYSHCNFYMENKKSNNNYEKGFEEIAENVVKACKEVFGFHDIDDEPSEFASFLSNKKGEAFLKMYFGITERGKQMEIIIVCNKNVQSEVGVGITIRNYKRAGKQDGK